MRLDPEEAGSVGECAGRDTLARAHTASAPIRGVRGLVLCGTVDHLSDLPVVVGARPAVPEFVVKVLDAAVEIALAPHADSLWRSTEPARDGGVGEALVARQDLARQQD